MSTERYVPQPVTVALIRALIKATPPDRPKEIRDRVAKLIVRHQPSGHISLYVELGRGKREQLCDARRIVDPNTTLTLAMVRDQAQKLRAEHRVDGRNFAAERKAERAVPTLEAFLDNIYGPWVIQNRRSGAETLARIESIFLDAYGNTRLTELTPAKLETWRAQRKRQGVSAETINRDIVSLRAALSRAVKLEVISENPLRGVEREKVDRHKQVVRALTASEKEMLIEALEARDTKKREERASANKWRGERGYELLPPIGRFADLLMPAVVVSLETGLRRGELLAFEWSSIDLKDRTLRVHGETVKTYETRDVPLNSLAHQVLRDWWLQCGQPKDGHVFTLRGERIANLKKSYHRVLAAAGIKRVNPKGERVNWHSLRHTFGSLLGAANVDPTTLMKLMGHANLETTQRYLHTDEDRKRAAVDLLSDGRG
jgi:integrase